MAVVMMLFLTVLLGFVLLSYSLNNAKHSGKDEVMKPAGRMPHNIEIK